MLRNIGPTRLGSILFVWSIPYAAAQTGNAAGSNSRVPIETVSAPIAPGVFHLVINALPNAGTSPVSPFVAVPGESVPPPAGRGGSGTFTGNPRDPSKDRGDLRLSPSRRKGFQAYSGS
jgi:hypothetical protein